MTSDVRGVFLELLVTDYPLHRVHTTVPTPVRTRVLKTLGSNELEVERDFWEVDSFSLVLRWSLNSIACFENP